MISNSIVIIAVSVAASSSTTTSNRTSGSGSDHLHRHGGGSDRVSRLLRNAWPSCSGLVLPAAVLDGGLLGVHGVH
jgi:hypothetical protein